MILAELGLGLGLGPGIIEEEEGREEGAREDDEGCCYGGCYGGVSVDCGAAGCDNDDGGGSIEVAFRLGQLLVDARLTLYREHFRVHVSPRP